MSSDHDDQTRTHITLAKGTKVSHYTIIDKIGAGGMGEVYLAEDAKLKRKVALKFLPAQHSADKDFRTRFTREAESTATLNHPNIITIYEVDEYNGRPYFAMELVEGQSLKDYSKDKALDIERIVELAIQICDGLGAAHDKNIIHRDIKPSNIVIDAYGRPKILDFGLAAIQGEEHLTKTGSTLGTVGYMSPEQISGKVVDERSDLFSFGLVLYELVAGKSPFRKDNDVATLKAITDDAAEPLARYKNDVPDELQRIISKLIEKDPAYRYQTAKGVVSDLKQVSRSISTGEVSSQTLIQARATGNSKKMKALLTTAVVVIIALLIVLKPWQIDISSSDDVQAANDVLAVMYFDNIVDSKDEKRLGEIITNLLISDLSEAEGLRVVSSQRLYDILKLLGHEGAKRIDRDVASQVAEKAKARWMLTGTILRTEPNFVITAQLIEVLTGNILASPRITGETGEDIFSLTNSLVDGIAESLLLSEIINTESKPGIKLESDRKYTNSAEAFKHYLDGFDLYLKFKRLKALESFKKSIALDSNFAMAYYRASIISQEKEDIDKAMELIKTVGKLDQMYIRAEWENIHGNGEGETKMLEQIIKEYPDEKIAYFILANIYTNSGSESRRDAIPLYEKVIEIDPLFKNVYNQMAYNYAGLEMNEKSIWAINKYIELSPDEPNPFDSRGELYGFQGEHEKALESYKKALEIDPEFTNSWRGMGVSNFALGNYDETFKWIDKFATHSNKFVRSEGRFVRTQILILRGKFQESRKQMDLALEMFKMEIRDDIKFPGFRQIEKADNFITMGRISEERQWLDSAKLIIDDILKKYETINSISLFDRLNLYNEKVIIEALLGNEEKVIEYLSKFEKVKFPTEGMKKIWLSYLRGDSRSMLGDEVKALEHFEEFVKLDRSSVSAGLIGISLFKNNKIGRAVEALEEATTVVDQQADQYQYSYIMSRYYLARAYEASGWTDKAIKQYEKFLHLFGEADEGIPIHIDAKERYEKLKTKS